MGRGDTLYGISRRTGVPVQTLIALNNIQTPNSLPAGMVLQLPAPAGMGPSSVVTPSPPAPYPTGPSGGSRGTIETESLPPLSPQPGSTRTEPLPPDSTTPSSAAPDSAAPTSTPADSSPGLSAAPSTPEERPRERQEASLGSAPAATPSSGRAGRSDRSFLKPVDGKIVSGFGPKSGGLRNDGINISAARGTPVRAAQDGTVAYAGNELPGFGNLVLVKHPNGWISAYGHNEEILVSKGQAVRRGQPIAKVGSSGNVVQPQLHFELRNGSRAIDPLPYLEDG